MACGVTFLTPQMLSSSSSRASSPNTYTIHITHITHTEKRGRRVRAYNREKEVRRGLR
jgi:hypothetical protein